MGDKLRMPSDYSKTSARIQAIRSYANPRPKVSVVPRAKPKRDSSFLVEIAEKLPAKSVEPVLSKFEFVSEPIEQVVAKLNTLEGALDPKVLGIDKEEMFKEFVQRIQKEQLIDVSHIKNMQTFIFNKTKYRAEELMHGGGTSASTITFYSDAVSGTIDGINKTFTVANTITTPLALYLANSVYQPTTDFTTSGTTITMVVAPDASLSGQPFWLLFT